MTNLAMKKRPQWPAPQGLSGRVSLYLMLLIGLALGTTKAFAASEADAPLPHSPIKPATVQLSGKAPGATADHSKFEILQQDFKSGPEVTKACLKCHTEAADQIHDSIHWTWEYQNEKTGQTLGKRTVINAFCGNVASNEPRCTSCHAGYGWDDMRKAPPSAPEAVDCLVCHADTDLYSKYPTKAGHPLYKAITVNGKVIEPPDLTKAAQSVRNPQRQNCGSCHYYGGGGDGVKHGDLDSSLNHPGKELDVHMREDGLNMACTACHAGSGHRWPGSRYQTEAKPSTKTLSGGDTKTAKIRKLDQLAGLMTPTASCESCHSSKPHKANDLMGIKLNNHTDTVACQTCHIPEFARGGVATKTLWDWSTAGKLKDGKPYTLMDEHGHPSYMSKKGDFEYHENVQPHYAWFNGTTTWTLLDDTIDPSAPVEINALSGTATDGQSRIWPFKRMHSRQPYDAGTNKFVYNHVFGQDDTALWTNFDWSKSVPAAMDYIGKDFSGELGFVDTFMYWPITHMVAPKSQAVKCTECHANQGRLDGITGVYLPGRDSFRWLDFIGYAVFGLTLLGVLIHTLLRILFRNRDKEA
ncbi:octaheme c-type cytochrome, tetrathionate reductase family [Cohaesibacter sp. ES.047]|uniref:tetrathionate reductase family octaheme c-type cytochrome n=1 Tax=Cohaesibacter sp. ES.047 TaxID=1798205 RepID=UPI000BC03BC4|nr:tetrathionate reductase family octaheme c-type cytochrome [Cohaesibacter sp. ES.047]SNY91534.1 octaheme c-type cytochrome, tetrathionate reductase family [Cohaesibacter sp. ES.047]